MSEKLLRALALTAFVLGAVVLLLADASWLRVASALVLIAFVVLALFAIATPEFLSRDSDD